MKHIIGIKINCMTYFARFYNHYATRENTLCNSSQHDHLTEF
jgi:hypothetical protein